MASKRQRKTAAKQARHQPMQSKPDGGPREPKVPLERWAVDYQPWDFSDLLWPPEDSSKE